MLTSTYTGFTIYSTKYCGYCSAAKNLLRRKGIAFKEIDIAAQPSLRQEVTKKYDWPTVPIIVLNDRLVGGFQELRQMDQAGELDSYLAQV